MNVQQIVDLNTRMEIAGKAALTRIINESGWAALAASPLMTSAETLLESLIKWDAEGRTFEGWKNDLVAYNTNKDLFEIFELVEFFDEAQAMVREGDLQGFYDQILIPSMADTTGDDFKEQLKHHREFMAEVAKAPCVLH